MPYREVIRTRKAAAKFTGHARTQARRIALAVTERFGGAPEGREYLDVYELQVRVGDELEERYRRLLAHDHEHAGELQRDRELRQERDRWMLELRELLLQLKRILDAHHPGASQKVFKEDPRVPTEGAALHHLAERAHDTLNDPAFTLPPVKGVATNPRLMAEGFTEAMHGLGAVLVAIDASESETKYTQSEKDALLEDDASFNLLVARFSEAFYALAGHPRLASRLRPSRHQRPGPSSEPGADPEPEPGAGGNAAPAAEEIPRPNPAVEAADAASTTEPPTEADA